MWYSEKFIRTLNQSISLRARGFRISAYTLGFLSVFKISFRAWGNIVVLFYNFGFFIFATLVKFCMTPHQSFVFVGHFSISNLLVSIKVIIDPYVYMLQYWLKLEVLSCISVKILSCCVQFIYATTFVLNFVAWFFY